MEVTTIGLDLAKNVFQVHGVDDEGTVVIRRQLRRSRVLPFFKKTRSGHWRLGHGRWTLFLLLVSKVIEERRQVA